MSIYVKKINFEIDIYTTDVATNNANILKALIGRALAFMCRILQFICLNK